MKIHITPGLHAALPTLRQRFLQINQPGNAKMQQVLKLISEQPTSRFIVFCNKLVKAEALHKYLCENMVTMLTLKSAEKDNKCKSTDTNANTNDNDNDNDNDTNTTTTQTTTTNINTTNANTLPSLFHGNLPPIQRASIIEKFTTGDINILVCTDLAARGLDTPWVNHVINFDFPRSLQDYLHRAGRTARAGRGGIVTSFVTAKDRALFEYIELAAKQRRIFSDPL